jgi:hypothetical protein
MRKTAVVALMGLILAGVVVADFNWNAESGNWADGANWDKGYKPDGTENVNLRKSSTSVCTLNTDEGLFSNRLMIQNGQTWNIEDGGRVGFAWSRIGYGGPAKVTMTGNSTFVLNNDDLYIGEINGNAIWTMYDTSSIVLADPSRNDDNLYIGKDGNGTLRIVGSKVTIRPSRIDFGWIRTAGCTPVSTLEYVMDEGGASTIVVQRINKIGDPDSTNHLVLSATAPLPQRDIVLIEATTGYGIGGKGKFDTLNGGLADEGTQIVLGGNVYALTYAYEANADGHANDIALVFLRSARYLAYDPIPANGAVFESSPTMLSWLLPDPNDGVSDIICTVYLGIEPPDPNRTNMDGVTLPANAASVEINAINFPTYGVQPLPDANDFYWVVDCVDTSPGVDPEAGKGIYWTFSTDYNYAPDVDAGPGLVTWGLPKVVTLTGAVTDDGKPEPPGVFTVLWTQTAGPEVTLDTPDQTTTTVTITESGVYEFTLTADDSAKQASDTVQVIVGTDSCQASYLNGVNYNAMDFNQDCLVDIVDFADFASQWLACTNSLEGCF